MNDDHRSPWSWLPDVTDEPEDAEGFGSIDGLCSSIGVIDTDVTTVMRIWRSRDRAEVSEVLSVLGIAGHRSVKIGREAPSANPIESGVIERIKLTPAESGPTISAVLETFIEEQLERYWPPDDRRRLEDYLIECYRGTDRAGLDGFRFRAIDFPAFDNGGISPGFGVLGQRRRGWDAPEFRTQLWCWSRVEFAHK